MTGHRFLYLLVLIWAVVFVGTFVMTSLIDGPRNLDTGFRRLDMLVRGQAVALILALIAAVAGFITRNGGKRTRLIGLIPIGITALLITALLIYATLQQPSGPIDARPPTTQTPTAPAANG